MATDPHQINAALARCDLERIVRQHLRGGVDPGQLLAELLDMCVNLRDMARVEAMDATEQHPGQDDRPSPVVPLTTGGYRGGDTSWSGIRPVGAIRWVAPVGDGQELSYAEHPLQGKAGTD